MSVTLTVFGKAVAAGAPQSFGINPLDGVVEDRNLASFLLEFALDEATGQPVCHVRDVQSSDSADAVPQEFAGGTIVETLTVSAAAVQARGLKDGKIDLSGETSADGVICLFFGGFCIDKRVEKKGGDCHFIFTLRNVLAG